MPVLGFNQNTVTEMFIQASGYACIGLKSNLEDLKEN
tara:strand:- start:517 stop:627 length:111 start_codon:yes stop_codon:yes gene_type:complete